MEEVSENNIPKKISLWKIMGLVILAIFFLILVMATYAYFFIINPSFVSKPIIQKPVFENITSATVNNTQEVVIKPEHILYLLNEIGAYKLHNTFNGEVPAIEFIVSDKNVKYYFEVKNNKIISMDGLSQYDLILKANQLTIIEIYDNDETKQSIMNHYNSGELEVEMVADTQTLALKGYSSLAEYFGISGMSILG
jgi:hypothetical protein